MFKAADLVSFRAWPGLIRMLLVLGLILVSSLGHGAERSQVALVQIHLIEAQIKEGLDSAVVTQAPVIQSAREGDVDFVPLCLREARKDPYTIIGVCDDNCKDLGLVLYDEAGEVVGLNLRGVSEPRLVVAPRWSGQFLLKVVMAQCGASEGCTYAIGIFGKEGRDEEGCPN